MSRFFLVWQNWEILDIIYGKYEALYSYEAGFISQYVVFSSIGLCKCK